MIDWILKKFIGSKNQRDIRRMAPTVRRINEIESSLASLSDEDIKAKTLSWKTQLSSIENRDQLAARLDQLLPEAFALVKHAARRLTERRHQFTVCDQPMTWEMIHFDVQLIGGIVLHKGRIAEMATGEGKTLVATLPVYLNALAGRGVHVVTVNDYLARRDGEWMGQLYNFLGLSVGIIQNDQPPPVRRQQYLCDITYGTNSELGFDYLRDNGMATSLDQQVQRGHFFAIVDEVDSILIDEARTPLIISGPATVSTHQFDRFKPIVEQLVKKQTILCNELAAEARRLLDAGKHAEAGRTLFKIKLGQPKNKAFLRCMEDPDLRRLVEKAELEFYKDTEGKTALVELKEELYFTIEERQHDADLTEKGRNFLSPDDPDAFVLPDLLTEFADIDNDPSLSNNQKLAKKAARQQFTDSQAQRIHNISQLLKAYCLYEKDVDYVVEDNKVIIVDPFTGRKMPGRRWSDGLHQAVEAKEGVQIDRETQTLATITIQNYFRLYEKLAGMTGTAETEANEFHDIYRLDVNVIPTNRPVRRIDENDRIYKTRREKYNAVIEAIKTAHAKGQPVLVGTASVEASELLSRMLKREKIPHNVLNAKYHMQEAEIIARAGQRGSVTISTNMAGRGTDIKLGPGVADLGGLFVIGTERHESRRIDRQLRGRCARQGDPGISRFYVSFEDDLMRNFGAADRMTKIMETFGLKEGEELEHPWLNKTVETAQKRVEQRNYLIRRRTLEFDDVMNQQREVIYGYRQEVLESQDPRSLILEVIEKSIPKKVSEFLEVSEGEPDFQGLIHWINSTFPLGLSPEKSGLNPHDPQATSAKLVEIIKNSYSRKAELEHAEALKGLERFVILNAIDRLWQEHLYAMDGLREAVYLRAFAQKDPLVEYKNEAFNMFTELMENIQFEVLNNLFRSTTNLQAFENFLSGLLQPSPLSTTHQTSRSPAAKPHREPVASASASQSANPSLVSAPTLELPLKKELPRVGRNDPCPCGSGKKFKHCCGRNA